MRGLPGSFSGGIFDAACDSPRKRSTKESGMRPSPAYRAMASDKESRMETSPAEASEPRPGTDEAWREGDTCLLFIGCGVGGPSAVPVLSPYPKNEICISILNTGSSEHRSQHGYSRGTQAIREGNPLQRGEA